MNAMPRTRVNRRRTNAERERSPERYAAMTDSRSDMVLLFGRKAGYGRDRIPVKHVFPMKSEATRSRSRSQATSVYLVDDRRGAAVPDPPHCCTIHRPGTRPH